MKQPTQQRELNQLVDNTIYKIDDLQEGLQINKNENVFDAIQEVIEAEKSALKYVLDGLTRN